MYDVSVQGVDERMINVHYYYYLYVHNDFENKVAHLATQKSMDYVLHVF